jgi:hypothetical protein
MEMEIVGFDGNGDDVFLVIGYFFGGFGIGYFFVFLMIGIYENLD